MTIERELLQEKLNHLDTRKALWQVQGQLLSVLMQQAANEGAELQRQMAALPADVPVPPAT